MRSSPGLGCERTSTRYFLGFGQFKQKPQPDLSPCAKHRIPLREQAMAVHLSGPDEHRVMKAMAGKPGIAMGKEPARANGDCGVDRVNSVAEGGKDFIC